MSIVNNNIVNYLTKIITKTEFLIASTRSEGQAEFGFIASSRPPPILAKHMGLLILCRKARIQAWNGVGWSVGTGAVQPYYRDIRLGVIGNWLGKAAFEIP
jgi:hypothetical protein